MKPDVILFALKLGDVFRSACGMKDHLRISRFVDDLRFAKPFLKLRRIDCALDVGHKAPLRNACRAGGEFQVRARLGQPHDVLVVQAGCRLIQQVRVHARLLELRAQGVRLRESQVGFRRQAPVALREPLEIVARALHVRASGAAGRPRGTVAHQGVQHLHLIVRELHGRVARGFIGNRARPRVRGAYQALAAAPEAVPLVAEVIELRLLELWRIDERLRGLQLRVQPGVVGQPAGEDAPVLVQFPDVQRLDVRVEHVERGDDFVVERHVVRVAPGALGNTLAFACHLPDVLLVRGGSGVRYLERGRTRVVCGRGECRLIRRNFCGRGLLP